VGSLRGFHGFSVSVCSLAIFDTAIRYYGHVYDTVYYNGIKDFDTGVVAVVRHGVNC